MHTRYVAGLRHPDIHPGSRHTAGFPPELGVAEVQGSSFPWPRVLVIEETDEGVFLDRLTEEGEPCGDTWHSNVQDAMDQAGKEYGMSPDAWKVVPPEITDDGDLITFALDGAS